jgi:small subunit ribosomal protein S6
MGSKGFAPVPHNDERPRHMSLYEHIYLARQDVTSQQVEALTETLKGIIEAHGGKVSKVEYWGVKSLAYRIRKNRKAHFTLMNIDAAPAAVTEMERQMRINEDVLRFMTIRVEELEEGQSVMLQKRDRDDRDERGPGNDRGFGGGRGGDRDRGDRGSRGPSGRAPRPRSDDSFADEAHS